MIFRRKGYVQISGRLALIFWPREIIRPRYRSGVAAGAAEGGSEGGEAGACVCAKKKTPAETPNPRLQILKLRCSDQRARGRRSRLKSTPLPKNKLLRC